MRTPFVARKIDAEDTKVQWIARTMLDMELVEEGANWVASLFVNGALRKSRGVGLVLQDFVNYFCQFAMYPPCLDVYIFCDWF